LKDHLEDGYLHNYENINVYFTTQADGHTRGITARYPGVTGWKRMKTAKCTGGPGTY